MEWGIIYKAKQLDLDYLEIDCEGKGELSITTSVRAWMHEYWWPLLRGTLQEKQVSKKNECYFEYSCLKYILELKIPSIKYVSVSVKKKSAKAWSI